jgi:hypothetical protein
MTKKNGRVASFEQGQLAKRVNLAEWRAGRLHELTLPSGLDVKVRDVDMTDLVLTGAIPNTLVELLGNEETQKLSEEEVGKKMLGENKTDFATLISVLVKAALVEPAIGDVPDDTHIMLDELSFADKMEIFNFVNRDASAVRPFREGSAEPAEAAQPG